MPPPSALRPGTQGTELPSRLRIKCLPGEEALSAISSPQKSKVTAPNQRRGGAGAGPGHVYASKTPQDLRGPTSLPALGWVSGSSERKGTTGGGESG